MSDEAIKDLTISHFIGDGNGEERKAVELVAASKMGLIVILGRDAWIRWKGNAVVRRFPYRRHTLPCLRQMRSNLFIGYGIYFANGLSFGARAILPLLDLERIQSPGTQKQVTYY